MKISDLKNIEKRDPPVIAYTGGDDTPAHIVDRTGERNDRFGSSRVAITRCNRVLLYEWGLNDTWRNRRLCKRCGIEQDFEEVQTAWKAKQEEWKEERERQKEREEEMRQAIQKAKRDLLTCLVEEYRLDAVLSSAGVLTISFGPDELVVTVAENSSTIEKVRQEYKDTCPFRILEL